MFSGNFTDYVKGFGGKFGVQTDRQDKCALGWDHQEKVQLHESQKGTSALSSLLFSLPALIWISCYPCEPCPGVSGTASQELMWGSFPVSAFCCQWLNWGLQSSFGTADTQPLKKSRLRAKCSLYEPASSLDYFPFSAELCKPQVRNSFVLPTNKISLLDSVVHIPISMQGESKTKCSASPWPVGYLFLWNTWCPGKIQLPVKCSCCSPALCLSMFLT